MKFVIDVEYYGTCNAQCTVNTAKERDVVINKLLTYPDVKHVSFVRCYKDGHISTRTYVC